MTFEPRWYSVDEVAAIYRRSPKYLKHVNADRRTPPTRQKYTPTTHRTYPEFQLIGGKLQVWGATLERHLRRQVRR